MRAVGDDRSDGRLVAAVLDGDRVAYAELVRRHQDRLHRRAMSIVGDYDLASDMVQESFIRAYERLADCADPDRFGGWIYRTVRNLCLDELRSPRQRGETLDGAVVGTANPGLDLERGEIASSINEALDTLSPALREAFVLKHVEGLEYSEMKAATGVAVSALKMRVKRAREELDGQLRPLFERAPDVTRGAGRTSTG